MHTYFHGKAGCHGYHYANEMKLYSWSSFPPDIHPESFIKIASLLVEIS